MLPTGSTLWLSNAVASGYLRKSFLIVTASSALSILPVVYFLEELPRAAGNDPIRVLTQYLKAAYARDFRTAYRFISSQDKRLKNEKTYVRERGPFTGFTLEMARRVAALIEAAPVEKDISGNHAHIKLKLKLPDANKLSLQLLEWDDERLNALSAKEQGALLKMLDKRQKEGKLDSIEGEEAFDLVKEREGWRVFLNWAAGVRIRFAASVPPDSSFAAAPLQQEVMTQPGELFTVAYRVNNLSRRQVSTRIAHHIEPKSIAQYLDIVECGLLFPVRLLPGEKAEYSTTYQIRGDLPDGVRQLAVTYEFKMDQN